LKGEIFGSLSKKVNTGAQSLDKENTPK